MKLGVNSKAAVQVGEHLVTPYKVEHSFQVCVQSNRPGPVTAQSFEEPFHAGQLVAPATVLVAFPYPAGVVLTLKLILLQKDGAESVTAAG